MGLGLEAYFMKDILDKGGSWGQALSAPFLLEGRVKAMEEKAKGIGALDAGAEQEELIEDFAARDYKGYAGGGIAGLSGGKRFGPPPESGPVPYGGGLSSQFNRVKKLTG